MVNKARVLDISTSCCSQHAAGRHQSKEQRAARKSTGSCPGDNTKRAATSHPAPLKVAAITRQPRPLTKYHCKLQHGACKMACTHAHRAPYLLQMCLLTAVSTAQQKAEPCINQAVTAR
jgi:hypothetical protein